MPVIQLMLENQRDQLAILQEQQATFNRWLELFKPPADNPAPGPDRQEQDLREMLELSAQMGNPEAEDILADESRLKAYIRYTRASM
jgi:hypothetical protein